MTRARALGRLVVALVAVAAGGPSVARAHGRAPGLGQVVFDAADRDHVVVRTTWGFLTTRDGGRHWTWQCAAAVPFDRTREDPILAMVPGGTLVAATFAGLVVSDPSACAWAPPALGPPASYVTDVVLDPSAAGRAWCIASPGATPDVLHRTDDGGRTWAPVATPHPRALTDRVRVAPSDPTRVYTSGVIPRTETEPRQGVLLRSDDGGETFRAQPVALLEPEMTVHLLAVDPTNADHLLVRAVRRTSDTTGERVLSSIDGGATFEAVLEAPAVAGAAFSADGRRAWIVSAGGLFGSDDGGGTFVVRDPALRGRCLGRREGAGGAAAELWVCADGGAAGPVLLRSMDEGATFSVAWDSGSIVDDVGCAADTPVGATCPGYWPDVLFDLGLAVGPEAGAGDVDGGSAPSLDAGVVDGGPVRDAGTSAPPVAGCACRAAPGAQGGLPSVAAIVAVATLFARRRRCG